ncbi:S-adenosylmethionine-dependent methyltransferase domain protein [Leptospira broomii serovar Hurstbridge str. 5399]|uniref:S-adenosylmethionine-dependent methyltransferase domain protein n=1 Tax=Leptospira broomii serovar Hurstbridge str. 5399 TaxID=1049789 RepID=T0GNB5_9LEPT|nr:class I SAM-dependent methyltransferase [Leptospira broomii]EQA46833.1 S-adenosylmethionine-dependent methyltransferase domain protein [Leptospira broomii serovar Hurstbridge str. 5399]
MKRAISSGTYELIDSGNFKKLEQIGPYKIIRPSPVSAWPPTKIALWKDADGEYYRSDKGGGNWKWADMPEDEFFVEIDDLSVKIRFTPFGHLGLFAEQRQNWNRIRNFSSQLSGNGEVLNLFAYSGLSTLSVLAGGMDACHLDASKGMVEWAKENAVASGLANKKVRWMVEDVLKFLGREIRRKKKYAGFILDPPTFGRGASGEVFKIERDLPEMMDLLMQLCDSKPEFVVLTCHSAGFSPLALRRILEGRIRSKGNYLTEELSIQETTGRIYPAGSNCIFYSERLEL